MSQDSSLEKQMLNAIELFHYSYRFRESLFVLVLEKGVEFREIMADLRLLSTSHIRIVILAVDDGQLRTTLDAWNLRGTKFCYHDLGTKDFNDSNLIPNKTSSEQIPVYGVQPNGTESIVAQTDQLALELATHFEAKRIYFLSSKKKGLRINDKFYSHLSSEEIANFLQQGAQMNIDRSRLQFFLENNQRFGIEFVLLQGESGGLFQEIFTHRGVGTLLTNAYTNVIRKAEWSDITDIFLLIKHHVHTGAILPLSEAEIGQMLDRFFVYSVNHSIVAVAKLNDYGDCAELGKFATLPRYQGKGRAFELAEYMIQIAREENKKMLFALSTVPKMWHFFAKLGFYKTERENLPISWKENYDFSRPSKAFRLDLH